MIFSQNKYRSIGLRQENIFNEATDRMTRKMSGFKTFSTTPLQIFLSEYKRLRRLRDSSHILAPDHRNQNH